jgi:hypothetical protein
VVVTATNAAGSTQATSPVTALFAALLPKNTALPSISGTLQFGKLLTATEGKWAGTAPISYTYQWQLCNAKGESSSYLNIPLATSPTFTLVSADLLLTLRTVVTATNAAGSTKAASAPTLPIAL